MIQDFLQENFPDAENSAKISIKFFTNLTTADIIINCSQIIDACAAFVLFKNTQGREYFIEPEYLSFWGYDIFAEILAVYFQSTGLDVNIPRSRDYYEDAKSKLSDEDLIRFCNDNKLRWKKMQENNN